MDKTFDLITIGDSTIDTFIKIHDATVECDINHRDCKICISYGAKIPVDSIAHGVAGNAANVAVGAARLGLKTATYTNLGDDEHGRTIRATLEQEGIDPTYIKVNAAKESNLSVVLTFKGERTIFVYHQDWYYHLPDLKPCAWVYLTSLAETFTNSNIINEVCSYVGKARAKLAFGPGTFQLKADVKKYPRLLEKCDVLFVNMEEAKQILEIDQQDSLEVRDILSKMLLLGPKIAVVTDGSNGSYASDGQKYLKAGIFPTQLVEKTGAGDAFASGFLAALFYSESLEEAMIWGTINAAHVISVVGPQRGLMTKDELIRHRKAEAHLVATSF